MLKEKILRRRVGLFVISLFAVLAVSTLFMARVSAATIVKQGVCGTTPYTISSDNVLTIGKAGGTYTLTYDDNNSWPWNAFNYGEKGSPVTKIEIKGKVIAGNSLQNIFSDFSNLKEIQGIENLEISHTTDLSYAFSDCSSLQLLNLSKWDTSKVENMESIFSGCTKLSSVNVSNWNIKNVKNLNSIFEYCDDLKTLDISGWDTAKKPSMSRAFYNVQKINLGRKFKFTDENESYTLSDNLPWQRWQSEKTKQYYTTQQLIKQNPQQQNPGWYTLTTIGITGKVGDCPYAIDKNNVLTIGQDNKTYHLPNGYSYYNDDEDWPWAGDNDTIKRVVIKGNIIAGDSLYGIFSLPNVQVIEGVSNINTSKTKNFESVFSGDKLIKSLDLSKWDTSNADHMGDIFSGCKNLTSLNVANWDTSKVQYFQWEDSSALFSGVFEDCTSLKTLDLSNWTTTSAKRMFFMFSDSGLERIKFNKNFKFAKDEYDGLWSVGLPDNHLWQLEGTNQIYTARQMMDQNPQQKNPGWYVKPVALTGFNIKADKDNLTVGDTAKITPTFLPADMTYSKAVTYTSSNPKVATVDNSGKVIAKGAGTAAITAKTNTGANDKTASVTITVKSQQKPAVKTITMYRLYNRHSGEHFYTSDVKERNYLISVGWNNEGVGWIAPASGSPVYRLYNRNGGEHHYTLSIKERNMLISAGWKDEGVGWYSGGSVVVYREYNKNAFANNHNYTPDKKEHDSLIKAGWRNEGTGWMAVSAK